SPRGKAAGARACGTAERFYTPDFSLSAASALPLPAVQCSCFLKKLISCSCHHGYGTFDEFC
ncbi:unnamed protein product, partial [Urochloa humidicola]